MKMVSNEEYNKQMEEKKAMQEAMKNKKFTPDIYMPKVGEQIQVQFVNATTVSEAGNGVWCHIINMPTKKEGKVFQLKVPCIAEEGVQECPLCTHKRITKNNFGSDCDESKTSFINPYIMINMNMQWDKTAKKFAPISDMKIVDGQQQLVELQPTLGQYLNTSKRFKEGLIKFITAQGGDISNKVITIQGVYMDKEGNVKETGEKFDKGYVFAVNTMIPPVDLSQFEIPEVSSFFAEKTEEEMDLFVNTGKWYVKKDENSGDVIRNSDIQNAQPQAPATPSQPAQAPVNETAQKYQNVPGVTFMTRED